MKDKREEAGSSRESIRTLCRPDKVSANAQGAPEQRLLEDSCTEQKWPGPRVPAVPSPAGGYPGRAAES